MIAVGCIIIMLVAVFAVWWTVLIGLLIRPRPSEAELRLAATLDRAEAQLAEWQRQADEREQDGLH